jgi:FMN phosphatase YigB (HAD superfamily)
MQALALFDLDDTLIDLRAAFRRFAAEFARARRLGDEGRDWLVESWNPYQSRDSYFATVRERYELRDSVPDLWAHYRRRMPELVTCRPEVRTGLTQLRSAGWRVGIVSNGEADNQLGKIERTGLIGLVDAVAVSGALGVRKPDRRIFAAAAVQAGCDLAEGGWMVGDNPDTDCRGGTAAGLRTVWIDDGSGRWPGQDPGTDHVVVDVVDAFALLTLD